VTQASAPLPGRRDRMRAATMEEITSAARRLLVEQGPEAMSLRAIAREIGMTAPGLYRYYSSREELFRHVIADMFRELAGDVRQAIDDAVPLRERGRGSQQEHVALKMVAACRAFRQWGLSHKGEFALLFGVPLPGLDDGRFDIAEQCALEFAGTFYTLFLELWNTVHFPVPASSEIDPGLRVQLVRFRNALGLQPDAPDGAILIFLRCWVVLYGAVSLEVFGHLGFALDDPAPMFEFTLADLARLVGLEYPLQEG
jgi:AcrR family transcriptional regulator